MSTALDTQWCHYTHFKKSDMKEHLISLEERAVLNTPLFPSLYFACSQLRDNLAIYQDVV